MVYNDLNDLRGGYSLILADPPWQQTRGRPLKVRPNSSGRPLDYPTMSLDDIKAHLMQATEKTTENSILFLWTIDKYLRETEEMAADIGYKLHARLIWDKVTGIPASFTIRYAHEYLLYLYKGKFTRVATEYRGKYSDVFREKVTKHSKKPMIAYEIIENLYPDLTKLEMYARNTREGWDSFGNEV